MNRLFTVVENSWIARIESRGLGLHELIFGRIGVMSNQGATNATVLKALLAELE